MSHKEIHRQLFLDTETTGIGIGHRILEVAIVEMINRQPTENYFQQYINPERSIDESAIQVHGITFEHIKDKPLFADIVDSMLAFIGDDEIIIHNAKFDVDMLDYELSLLDQQGKSYGKLSDYCNITDSLSMARKKISNKGYKLDDLCQRFNIDLSDRKIHGALIDCHLLAKVYLALTSDQIELFADLNNHYHQRTQLEKLADYSKIKLPKATISKQEQTEHEKYLEFLDKMSNGNTLWQN